MIKRKHCLIAMIMLVALVLFGCTNSAVTDDTANNAAKILTEVKTAQFFTEEKVLDEDMVTVIGQ